MSDIKEKIRVWWETDNAKAIATVIAVLLIPIAVIAWNYASNTDSPDNQEIIIESSEDNELEVNEVAENTEGEVQGDSDDLTNADNQNNEENENADMEESTESNEIAVDDNTQATEAQEGSDSQEAESSETANAEGNQNTEETSEEEGGNFISKLLKGIFGAAVVKEVADNVGGNGQDAPDENADSSDSTGGTDQANGSESQSSDSEQATGGMEGVTTLPETSAYEYYVVQKSDTIYSISQEICGDDSFYKNNYWKNNLVVGQEIEVECE